MGLFITILLVLFLKFKFNMEWKNILIVGGISYLVLWLVFSGLFFNFTLVAVVFGIIFIVLTKLGKDTFSFNKKEDKAWYNKGYDENIDLESSFETLEDEITDCFQYNHYNIPLGRSTGFILDFNDYPNVDVNNIEFLGYSPKRSLDKVELQEFGTAFTNQGIFIKIQEKNKDKSKGKNKFITSKYRLGYEGLREIKVNNEQVIFKYYGKKNVVIAVKELPWLSEQVLYSMNNLIEKGVTRNMLYEEHASTVIDDNIIENNEELNKAYKAIQIKENLIKQSSNSFITGQISTLRFNGTSRPEFGTSTLSNNLNDIQLNAQNKQILRRNGKIELTAGKGEAAEYANNIIDTLKGRKVKHDGSGFTKSDPKGQGRNAVDRTVVKRITGDTIKTQSKYCKTAKDTFNEFQKGNYPKEVVPEVPAEQWNEFKRLMKEAGDDRQVIKGVSSRYAKAVTKAGTIESLSMDLANGAIQSAKGASISFLIVFAQAKMQGLNNKEAAKISARAGLQTVIVGAAVYAGGVQFARSSLGITVAKRLGKKSTEVASKASGVIVIAIVFGPAVIDSLRGRISPQQLIKTSAIGAAGMVGAAIGTATVPVPVLGSIVGGVVGGMVGKKFLDTMIEDDAEEIYQIFKEELIEIIYALRLTKEEIDILIQRTIQDKKFSTKTMKDIYQVSHQYQGHERELVQRKYIKENYLDCVVDDLFKKHEFISNSDIEEANKYNVEFLSSFA